MQILLHLSDPDHLARLASALSGLGDEIRTAGSLAELKATAAGGAFDAVAAEYSAEIGEWVETLEEKRVVFLTDRSVLGEVAALNPGITVLPLPGTALAVRCVLSPATADDPACRLADYQLLEIEALGRNTHLFSALQVSIARPVVLHLLNQECDEDDASLRSFLGDARAKAAVSHDRIGTVYQALEEGSCIFYTAERLTGPTLADYFSEGRRLPVRLSIEVVRVLASATQHLEARQLSSSPIELRHIHLAGPEHNTPKLVNTAIAGTPEAGHHGAHFQHSLGEVRPMIDPLDPLAARVLNWLDGYLQVPPEQINLSQVVADVRRHAAFPAGGAPDPHPFTAPTAKPAAAKPRRAVVMGAAAVVVVAVAVMLAMLLRGKHEQPKAPETLHDRGSAIRIAGGDFDHPQRGPVHIAPFSIDKYEVTIGEYAAFLDAIGQGDPARFNHPSQPERKADHKPKDWDVFHAAAAQQGAYKQARLTLDCPVFNVDWWDAYAYAKWKQRRLPTEDEWELAVGGPKWTRHPWGDSWDPGQANCSDKPAPLSGHTLWCPVNLPPTDVSAAGIQGLAGNVSEWTDSEQVHPDFPDRMAPVVKGGSFTTTGSIDRTSRLLVLNKNQTQPWLGFRTATTLGSPP